MSLLCDEKAVSPAGSLKYVGGTRTKEMPFRQLAAPPLLLGQNGKIADLDTWEWVLVDIHDSKIVGVCYERFDGAGVWTYTLRFKHGYATYVNMWCLGATNRHLPAKLVAISKGMVLPSAKKATLMDVISAPCLDSLRLTRRANARTGRKILERQGLHDLFPQSKIASGHHLHIKPDEAFDLALRTTDLGDLLALVGCISKMVGAGRATVASMLAFAAFAKKETFSAWLSLILFHQPKTIAHYMYLTKQLTVRCKQLQHAAVMDLVQLFETEVLVNRGVGVVDWNGEKRNRMHPDTIPVDGDRVFEVARRIFTEGRDEGFKYKPSTVKQWWKNRWLHVPAGSAHVSIGSLVEAKERCKNLDGFGKKLLISSVKTMELPALTARRPHISGRASVKYEWGKQRAIYGTDVESFILSDLAYPSVEQSMPRYIITGNSANEENVRREVSAMSEGMLPFCFDYEDFNSQHSFTSMNSVLRAFRSVYQNRMTSDQVAAAIWTESSVFDQRVGANLAAGHESYSTSGTLLSGWRLTTLVNSVLNRVYLEEAGALENSLHAIHSGDDVLFAVKSVGNAEKIRRGAIDFGIRAQTSKAATGSIAEFLRIDHKGSKNGSQYLARAVATSVHSRIESGKAVNPESLMLAHQTRVNELIQRGADTSVAQVALGRLIAGAEKVFGMEPGSGETILQIHPLRGGLDQEALLDEREVIYDVSGKNTEDDERDLLEGEKVVEAMKPGIQDFVEWLSDKAEISADPAYLIDRVNKATVRNLVKVRRRAEISTRLVTCDEIQDQAMYAQWRQASSVGLGSIIKGLDNKLVTLAHAVLDDALAVHISKEKDIDRLLRVMF